LDKISVFTIKGFEKPSGEKQSDDTNDLISQRIVKMQKEMYEEDVSEQKESVSEMNIIERLMFNV
jgi:hypothetical protein